MDQSLVAYRAQNIRTSAVGSYLSGTLRVLQEYRFNCSSTNITSLILGIDVRPGYKPLQVRLTVAYEYHYCLLRYPSTVIIGRHFGRQDSMEDE
uniref:Uncharacterized protein n=1 Tax=Amphimedon queenslandica TaxID=400682 RepID=A0A1X7TLC7_AMPQE